MEFQYKVLVSSLLLNLFIFSANSTKERIEVKEKITTINNFPRHLSKKDTNLAINDLPSSKTPKQLELTLPTSEILPWNRKTDLEALNRLPRGVIRARNNVYQDHRLKDRANFENSHNYNRYGGAKKNHQSYGDQKQGATKYSGEENHKKGHAAGYSKGYEKQYNHEYSHDFGQDRRQAHGFNQRDHGLYGYGTRGYGNYGLGLYGDGYHGYGNSYLGSGHNFYGNQPGYLLNGYRGIDPFLARNYLGHLSHGHPGLRINGISPIHSRRYGGVGLGGHGFGTFGAGYRPYGGHLIAQGFGAGYNGRPGLGNNLALGSGILRPSHLNLYPSSPLLNRNGIGNYYWK